MEKFHLIPQNLDHDHRNPTLIVVIIKTHLTVFSIDTVAFQIAIAIIIPNLNCYPIFVKIILIFIPFLPKIILIVIPSLRKSR